MSSFEMLMYAGAASAALNVVWHVAVLVLLFLIARRVRVRN